MQVPGQIPMVRILSAEALPSACLSSEVQMDFPTRRENQFMSVEIV